MKMEVKYIITISVQPANPVCSIATEIFLLLAMAKAKRVKRF